MNEIKLSKRLKAVANYVDNGAKKIVIILNATIDKPTHFILLSAE